MDVVLSGEREGDVDDDLDVGNIETSGGNIGGDENGNIAALESVQRLCALVLGQITVDAADLEAAAADELFDAGGLLLVQAEDEDTVALVLAGLVLLEQLDEAILLGVLLHDSTLR